MSKYLIAGNWKMNTGLKEGKELVKALLDNTYDESVEILICPPFTHLATFGEMIASNKISLGAQNSYFEEKGAFTGEVSNQILKSVGCQYVIIGHSERRALFGETDELINRKIISSLKAGLKTILCIGETLEQQQNGETHQILETQLLNGLKDVKFDSELLTIAYEPVWAIGTGLVPSSEQIAENHSFIRSLLETKYPDTFVKILYGGSLNAKNADEILAVNNVNGGLIGGASLDSNSFLAIYKSAQKLA